MTLMHVYEVTTMSADATRTFLMDRKAGLCVLPQPGDLHPQSDQLVIPADHEPELRQVDRTQILVTVRYTRKRDTRNG